MIRIGIVGCGRILAAHLRGYRLLREAGIDDFRVTALCARRADDARMYLRRGAGPAQRPAVSQIPGDPLAIGDEYLSDFQDDVEAQVYDDYRQMMAEAPIDAVNDFSTHSLHHQVAAAAFAHGKHLLTQKPLAVTMAAARRMCDDAEARGLTFGVFENFRHALGTRHLRWAFDSETLGALQMIFVGAVGLWWAPDLVVAHTPWRHKKLEGGGISLDLGVHFFDQIRHVGGELCGVEARTAVIEPIRRLTDPNAAGPATVECDADDTVLATFDMERGAVGQLSASWAGHGAPLTAGNGIVYFGSRGRATGDEVTTDAGDQASLSALYLDGAPPQRRQQEFPHGLSDSFALAQLDWLNAVRERRAPQTDGREGLRDLAAAYALLESATLGQRVLVSDVLDGTLREYQRPLDEAWGLG